MQVSVVAADGLESLGRQMATLIGRSPGNGATLYSVKHYRDSEPGLFVNDEKNIAVVFLGPSSPANDTAQMLPQCFYGYGVDCRRGGRRATIIANSKDPSYSWHIHLGGYGLHVEPDLRNKSMEDARNRLRNGAYDTTQEKALRDEIRHNTQKFLEEIPWLQADPGAVAAGLLFDKTKTLRPANPLRWALGDRDVFRDEAGLIYWGSKKDKNALFVDTRVAYGYGVARFLAHDLDEFTSPRS